MTDALSWANEVLEPGVWRWTSVEAVQARVWRGEGPAGAVRWLKVHRDGGAAAREVRALRVAAGVPGTAPLLAWRDRALILDHVVGAPPGAGHPEVWRAVGAWLHGLHTQPVGSIDPMPVHDALTRRAAAWAARSGSPAGGAVLAMVAGLVEVPTRRAWCHRDVQPHNLRWSDGGLGVIDLGQARPDLVDVDVVKLLELPDVLTAADRAALWVGLQRPPCLPLLRALTALHGLATATWADHHGDVCLAARGRAILAHALDVADWSWCTGQGASTV